MEYRPNRMDQGLDHAIPLLLPTTMDISADISHRARMRLAWRDLTEGSALWRLGMTLGWLDIKLRYRGSLLGPFWLTISTAVWVAAMGALYSLLFHMTLAGYLPFLALSLVLWTAIGAHVGDACNTFLQSETTIRSVRMPFFVHAIRVVVRTVIGLSHNIPVILVVFALYGTWPGWGGLMALPGLALWLLDAFAACLTLGAVCARFRDIPPIIGSIMQIAFYITPIIWRPEQLKGKIWWLAFNPFDALLEIVRQPLLGGVVPAHMWSSALVFSAGFCAVTALLFARIRSRLAYWM
jgi:lipopolysaccharide transport system permease protein